MVYDTPMIEDLDLLASRLRQLTELIQSLRDENAALDKSVTQRDSHIRMLRETLAAAQSRVEGVLTRLPGGEEPPEGTDGDAEAPDSATPPAAEGADPGARSLYGTS